MLAAILFMAGAVTFQGNAVAQSGQKPAAVQKIQPQNAPATPQDVSGPEMSMLIRGTMVALHQANVTGNYTVLRDLGANSLRQSNSAADLAVLFSEFRQQRFNLGPIVLYDAVLDQKPKLTIDGFLQLIGHFPTKPQEVLFDMTFHFEGGGWRIAVLKVGSRMAVASADDGAKPAASNKTQPKPAAGKPAPKPPLKPAPASP
jgi:hypothetical protein